MVKRTSGDLVAFEFESLSAARALVSTRHGGCSKPPYAGLNLAAHVDDDPAAVMTNRVTFFDAFGLDLDRSVWCRQVHGDTVIAVTGEDAGRGARGGPLGAPQCDAMVTDTRGLALCVLMADCVPVVVHDPVRDALGVAHAGWAGTVRRIASKTVEAMSTRYGSDPSTLRAAIGPSIGPEDYEVAADVIAAARAGFGDRAPDVLREHPDPGKARFDLWEANAIDLESAGVARTRIEIAGISTSAAPHDFFSHRREGRTGRFATVAMLS